MRTGVVTAVLAIGLLAGCSGQDEQDSGQASPPPAQPAPVPAPATSPPPGVGVHLDTSPALEEIRMRGKLLVGLRADAPQFAQRDAAAGGYRGFDVEIARRIAQGLGLDPQAQVAFRMLPPSLQGPALSGGSVDLQIGGVDPASGGVAAVPYAVVDGQPEYAGIRAGDEVFRQRIADVLRTAVADGSWQRADDTTLAPAGVTAEPPR